MHTTSRNPAPGKWRALLLCLSLSACTKSTLQVNVREGDALPVQAAAVYPFGFRWPEPAYRSYELSEALVLQVLASNRYAVFGPGEFKLLRATAENPFIGSDLALGLADHGLAPTEAIVFRPSAEKRAQMAMKEVFDVNGKPKGSQAVEEVVYVGKIEVFHSKTREIIADALDQVEVDPFATRDPNDPASELTTLMKRLMELVLSQLATRAPGARVVRPPGFEYLFNPKTVFDFALEGRPAYSAELEKADILDQDLLTEARMRFFLPAVDDTTLGKLKRLPGGLFVTRLAPSGNKAGLKAGDLVVEVKGEPAHPQTLHRVLRTTDTGKTVPLKVLRGGETVTLALTVEPPVEG